MNRLSRTLSVGASALAVIALAACGSSSKSSSTTDSGASSTSGDSSAALARAQAAVDTAYKGTSFKTPATDSPAAVPGKNVWLVIFSLGIPQTKEYADAVRAAGKALGWKVTVFDGKGSANEYLNGIADAVTDHADGLVLYGVDCASVTAGLKRARAAGVKVVGSESMDCSQAKKGAPSYFDGQTEYTQGDLLAWERYIGELQADWITVQTQGKAEALEIFETDTGLTQLNHQGFQAGMKKNCPGCTIHQVLFTANDFGPPLQQKVSQALLQNPKINAAESSYDGIFTSGAAAAIRSSGHKDDIHAIGGVGSASAIDLIRSDAGLNAGYGVPLGWEAYDSMDILNRLFSGAEMSPSGIGLGLYDETHGLPPAGEGWKSPIDYVKAYETAWAR